MANKKARVIAFYLPQFHPIPENDEFWGKGFTEWTNVAQAKPLFKGHYQPRVPLDLGYYDLRLPIIREQQAEMAREAGVEGFMYWHYWFGNGKMLLEKPFEEVLASGKPDYPFCLGWANHTWSTKTWHQKNGFDIGTTLIAEQLYPGVEDDIAHFNYCLPAFKDHRYMTVDGKPIFFIWAPAKHTHVKEFIELWQKLAKEKGFPGIHFIGNSTGREVTPDKVLAMGFDAVCCNRMWSAEAKVVGSKWRRRLTSLLSYWLGGITLSRYDYAKVMKYMNSEDDKQENFYPTILPGYDRSPRAGRAAQIYYNSTPEAFKKHVHDTLEYVKDKQDDHKIVILKSWNEWGESNYMEPDRKYGHAYLDALADEVFEK